MRYRLAYAAGCEPSEMIFVDDRQENVDAAAKLGITALLYTEFSELEKQLSALTAPATA